MRQTLEGNPDQKSKATHGQANASMSTTGSYIIIWAIETRREGQRNEKTTDKAMTENGRGDGMRVEDSKQKGDAG